MPPSPSQATWLGHPRGLLILFSTELWERFSFYGMRALLVLYLLAALELPADRAYAIYGVYGAMCYGSAVAGGWIASRYLGEHRSIIIGSITMAIGHLVLTIQSVFVMCLGLAFICVGNGLFKPNISSRVGQLYPEGDDRRQRGFYIFYVGINLGSMSAPLICGPLGERVGWHVGFGLAGLGMLIGLAVYLLGRRHLPSVVPPTTNVARAQQLTIMGIVGAVALAATCMWVPSLGHAIVGLASVSAIAALVAIAWRSPAEGRRRIWALLALMLFHTVFWAAFEQAGSSFNVLTDRFVDRTIGDLEIPASAFQAVNGSMIVVLTPMIVRLWQRLDALGRDPSVPLKFALGLALLAAGFGTLAFGTRLGAPQTSVALGWLLACYLLHTIGELCLSPVGLSTVTRLLPARLSSFGMGAWFMTYANGHIVAGLLASQTVDSTDDPYSSTALLRYADVFEQIGLSVLGAAALLLFLVPKLRRQIG